MHRALFVVVSLYVFVYSSAVGSQNVPLLPLANSHRHRLRIHGRPFSLSSALSIKSSAIVGGRRCVTRLHAALARYRVGVGRCGGRSVFFSLFSLTPFSSPSFSIMFSAGIDIVPCRLAIPPFLMLVCSSVHSA